MLAKRKKRLANGKSFLIISTTGLGDTLWGTPAIRSIKESFPEIPITVLTSPIGKEVLSGNPLIEEIFVVTDPVLWPLWKMRKRLHEKKFSHAIIFHSSQRIMLPFLSFLQIPTIIGSEGMHKGLDELLTTAVPLQKEEHEIARRLRLAKALGAVKIATKLEIFPTADLGWKKPFIALHPGAKDAFKLWPKEHFISLGKMIMEKLAVQLIITGNNEEKNLCESIAEKIPGAISLAGQLSVQELAAFLSNASLFITGDTGPMHIAFSQKTPTIALFSPTNPRLCGPYLAENAHIVFQKQTCFPCLRKKCKSPFCMMQISPKEIANYVINIWNDSHEKPIAK